MAKTVVKKLSFSELKIEKVKFVNQSSTKIFCSSVCNVGGGLATWLLIKNRAVYETKYSRMDQVKFVEDSL